MIDIEYMSNLVLYGSVTSSVDKSLPTTTLIELIQYHACMQYLLLRLHRLSLATEGNLSHSDKKCTWFT